MTTDLTGWEEAAQHLGYEGMTSTSAGRTQHLVLLPMWEAKCTCWRDVDHYPYPSPVLAGEHVRCHQKDCDVHSGAVDRWLETQGRRS